jgi:adenylate kinase
MRISLIGLPGAGKTTLANILSGMFNQMIISSGDLARSHGFAGSKEEKSGQLDPDENKIRKLVKEAIGDSDQYILDGFPRTIEQIRDMDILLDVVLYLNLGDHTHIGVERLLARGRPDDLMETIAARVATYQVYTHPLVAYFLDQEKLIYINATGTIAETLRQAVVQLAARNTIEASKYIDTLLKEFEDDYTVKKVRKYDRPPRDSRGVGNKG